MQEHPQLLTNRLGGMIMNRDTAVVLRSARLLVAVMSLSLSTLACKDDDGIGQDASTDTLNEKGDVAVDTLNPNTQCDGVAPMGGCAFSSNGCCDDAFGSLQLVCRSGKWSCPAGYSAFNECCGVGNMCQPYPGGGQPPSPACAAQCRQSGGAWFCGSYFPDGGAAKD